MKKFLLLINLFFVLSATAQDAHFSQFNLNPIYLNPSYTGQVEKTVRMGVNYRSQWSKVAKSYSAISAFVDGNYKGLGMGFLVHQNSAGASSIKHSGIHIALSYHKALLENRLEFGGGLKIGGWIKAFDPSKFTYDEQYTNETGFDASNPITEQYQVANVFKFNTALGFHFKFRFKKEKKSQMLIGLAFDHLNTPNMSFTENSENKLPLKTTINASVAIQASKKLTLSPNLLFQKQASAHEVVLGLDADLEMKKSLSLLLGAGMRFDDAFFVKAGVDFKSILLQMSYDANFSSLKNSSKGFGAVEMGAIIVFNKFKKSKNIILDKDQDGILDVDDQCPEIPGLAKYNGCNFEDLDYDGDGVPDIYDNCKYIPGDAKFGGCMDSDLDGIGDHEDECPFLAGELAYNGCPYNALDSDKDGLPDKDDKCPYIKGFIKFDGCPDTDMDNIPDNLDACPFVFGTFGRNGCPAIEKERVANKKDSFDGKIIYFLNDYANIDFADEEILNKVIKTMNANPEVTILISGHTNDEGSLAYNYKLGVKRSIAIRDYLLKKGISYNRLKTVSYGKLIPHKNVIPGLEREMNRRGEIHFIVY